VLRELDGGHALLADNPHWHGARGNVAEIEITFQESPGDDWRAGRYDFLIWAERLSELEDAAETLILTMPVLGTSYLGFHQAVARRRTARLRRALAGGLGRAPAVRDARVVRTRLAYGGFLPPAMPGHSHDLAPSYDPARARALLAEAGFPDGRGLPELR